MIAVHNTVYQFGVWIEPCGCEIQHFHRLKQKYMHAGLYETCN